MHELEMCIKARETAEAPIVKEAVRETVCIWVEDPIVFSQLHQYRPRGRQIEVKAFASKVI